MHLIALLSGGKDSVYNAIEATRLGHTIVCAANLHPPQGGPDELDSWMYQTVGWNAVPLVAAALGVPLIRRATSGSAVHTGLAYPAAAAPGDEVEDLFALLRDAAAAHPTARGVAVGAILSGYQRARVEAVCARLRLVPVALLWAREQRALLKDMVRSSLRAALVKVAAHGLTARTHLGRDVAALRRALRALAGSHGLNACGEGGEYETLALDSPLHARGAVELTEVRVVEQRGGVAHLHVVGAALREARGAEWAERAARLLRADWRGGGGAAAAAAAAGPPFVSPYDGTGVPVTSAPEEDIAEDAAASAALAARGSVAAGGGCVCVALSAVLGAGVGAAARATRHLLAAASTLLAARGSSLHEALFVRLYLPRMAAFAEVNGAFARFWEGAPHPPARLCVELRGGGGAEEEVRLDALCAGGGGGAAPERALHVASLSKWAPLCIGPYCQATTLGGAAVFCAGQIGLVPETMALRGGGLRAQMRQALLNAARVAAAAGGALTGALSLQVFLAVGEDGCDNLDAAAAAMEASAARWVMGTFGGKRGGARGRGRGSSSRTSSSSSSSSSGSEGAAPRGGDCGSCSGGGADARSDGCAISSDESSGASEDEGAPLVPLNQRDFPLGARAHEVPPYAAGGAPLPVVVLPVPSLPRGALVELELLCARGDALAARGPIVALQRGGAPRGGLSAHARAHILPGVAASAWVHVAAVAGRVSDGAGSNDAALMEAACGALVEEGARALVEPPAALPAAAAAWHVRVFFVAEASLTARGVAAAMEGALRRVCVGAPACVAALPLPALPPPAAAPSGSRALLLAHFAAFADPNA
jgi:diphthine-ammonia ligase